MWPAPNITLLEDTQHQRQDQTKLIWLGKFFKMDQKKEQAQVMQREQKTSIEA